ncbi:MAG: prolyl oligopeptidase family serine peptidase [Chloroflexia bacterium]
MPTMPPSRQEPVEEVLHGRTNRDPYRWLEDETSPEVQAWVAAQNEYAEAELAARPERAVIRARMAEMLAIGSVTPPVQKADRYFYTRREGTEDQPILYLREGPAGPERVLLDPNATGGSHTVALDWWYPSEDGRLLAYGYSDQGDEKSTLYLLDVDGGELLPDRIPHTRYASVAWEEDSRGFYYTRNPSLGSVHAGEEVYHKHVFYHRLGTDPASDPELFGAGREMTEMPWVQLSSNGRWLVGVVGQGTTRDAVFVRDLSAAGGSFVPLVEGVDAVFMALVRGDTLYMHTNWEAPHYRVMAVDLENPARKNWREVVPDRPDVVIEGIEVVGDRVLLNELKDVVARLGVWSTAGEQLPAPDLPPLGTITGLHGKEDGDDLFIGFESYTVPPTVYRYNLPTGEISEWASVSAPLDLSKIEVEQVWYSSKDGTRVPMMVIGPRGLARNGDTPTVLNGYGGFTLSRGPVFTRAILPWIEMGGIYAVANLRGGNEYGEEWHRAGMLGNKQNVFDDFIAAAEYLISAGYTRPECLGISGRSNGGLLVGAALTQRPDLFEAVVCTVPLLDMLRYHNFRIARFWISEYGSAEDPEQIGWLWDYSPYQHTRPGTDYPAVLFTTAESDSRVDPLHARKMTALLQGNNPRRPILLWVETAAGHGIGKPLTKMIEEQTDIWTFLAWRLGLVEKQG